MLNKWHLALSKCFIIPQRYVFGIMGFFALINSYAIRVVLSIAITEMVPPVETTNYNDSDLCSANQEHKFIRETFGEVYNWSEPVQGLILSSFFWGYLIAHVPSGILAEKYGGKHPMGLGMLICSIATLLTPWTIYVADGGWKSLVFLRFLIGAASGPVFPALTTLLAQWTPLSERSTMGALVYSGGQIGTIISIGVSGSLIKYYHHWEPPFYVFGGLGLLWCIIWTLICYSSPSTHPFISENEKNFLKKELDNVSNEKLDIPWKAIFTSIPVWALIGAEIGHDWGLYTMTILLPKYMSDVLKFKVEENGWWNSLPNLAMWMVSIISGKLCDWIISKGWIGITNVRKISTATAHMGPAIFIMLASYSGCDKMLTVAYFTIGFGFMGTFCSGFKVNCLDLAPNFSGTLMAIVNGIGCLTGIIAPYLGAILTEDHTLSQWRTFFWVTFVTFFISNLIYACFAGGEVQSWNDPNNRTASSDANTSESNQKNDEIEMTIVEETKAEGNKELKLPHVNISEQNLYEIDLKDRSVKDEML